MAGSKMTDLRDASLIDFLPESIASDAEIIALSLAVDPELRAVGAAIVEAVILPRIADLPETVLNELAWAFRLNELQIWDSATLAGKRNLLVNIFAIRKKSGTRFAVRRIFDLLSVVGELVEWFEEGAAPYTYRLRIFVTDVGVTLAQLLQIPELTHRFESTRSQLSELAVESNQQGPLLLYPALTIGNHTTIPFGGP
jgi:phage tail P2-like protein